MQKIPIEYYNLNLFERLDRPVIAFVKKRPFRKVENLHVFASTEAYEKERRKFEITGYKAQTIPLGMSLDAVIWQPYYVNLVISGLDTRESDGKHYVSVKCFLTRESAEKFNMNNRPVTPANLGYLKYFWCKPVIIEPHRDYWIEFL